jgi:outer membrane lipoprotein SlyB
MRKAFVWTTTLLLGVAIVPGIFGKGSRSGSTSSAAANTAAQTKKRITVPAGTRILIRMVDSIDTTKQTKGYRFTATLETNLQAEDAVVAPRGTTLYGRLVEAASAGRMSGSSELTLELTDIVINGTAHPLLTSTYEVKGKGEGGNTAKKVVGGAGLGALIGGIAGGGKGAGIGAAAGAATGTVVAGAKKGQQLQIPSETLLEFRLQQPVSLPVAG